MKRLLVLAACLSLAACEPTVDSNAVGNATNPMTTAQQVELKSTTALSLAELAFNTGEQTATNVLRSGHLSKSDTKKLGDAVHDARADRDKARLIVAAGGDASAVLENLNTALSNIALLTAGKSE